MLTFGSLFAGIGGLDLGLERAGMTCKWQVEIDDYATRVLERHWPTVRRWRDVKTFPPDAVSEQRWNESKNAANGTGRQSDDQPNASSCDGVSESWYVDLVCGGFPCQDISYAGRGAGLAGERSGLFFEALRVVRQLQPRYVLLENVAALLTRGLDRVLGELAAIGYDAEWHCIPAAAVGAPHIRDRVFVLAYSISDSDRTDHDKTPEVGRWQVDSQRAIRWPTTQLDGGSAVEGARIGSLITEGPSPSDYWAVEPDVGRVVDGLPARVDRLRGLGNAVVPQVAEWIGHQIMNHTIKRLACGGTGFRGH